MPNQTITILPIAVTVACSLTGSETFAVVFRQPSLFKDVAGNSFQQPYLTVAARRYSYISTSELQAVQASGATISAASLISLGLVIGVIALQLLFFVLF